MDVKIIKKLRLQGIKKILDDSVTDVLLTKCIFNYIPSKKIELKPYK